MHREVVQRREVRPPLDDVAHLLVHGPKGVLPASEAEVQEAPQQEHVQALVVLPVCMCHRTAIECGSRVFVRAATLEFISGKEIQRQLDGQTCRQTDD